MGESPDSNRELGDSRLRIKRYCTSILFALVLAVPALAMLFFIYSFGVNVLRGDDWDTVVPLLQKSMTGTLSPTDFFVQQNEHRIPIPKIFFFVLAKLTHLKHYSSNVSELGFALPHCLGHFCGSQKAFPYE